MKQYIIYRTRADCKRCKFEEVDEHNRGCRVREISKADGVFIIFILNEDEFKLYVDANND